MDSTYYRFDEITFIMELFALRDIKPGEELSYSCKFIINHHIILPKGPLQMVTPR